MSSTSPHGTHLASRGPPKRTRSATTETITVTRSASPRPRFPVRAPTRATTWPFGVGTPSRFGSSPRMTRMVRPSTEAGDNRLGEKLRHPADAEEACNDQDQAGAQGQGRRVWRGLSRARTPKPASSEPDSTDTVDTGPTMSCRDEPKIAYATSATGTA